MREMLVKSQASLSESDFSQEDLTNRLNQLLEETGQKPGVLFSLIRIATTWAPSSPGLAETLNVLGKDKSLERLDKSIQLLS
jgi:glutamyl/glutaminyl-tRNA synthetase